MSAVADATVRSGGDVRVTRSRRNVAWTGIVALVVVAVFAMLPYIVYAGTTGILVQAFIVLTLASMWNLLAGYAGLVSVGQQAFLGLGAYFVLIPAMHGVSPFAALPIGAIGAGIVAIPMWWLVSRLRTGYFAIATWVLATAVMLFVERFQSIGGGTGMPLPGLAWSNTALLSAATYWAGLAVTVLAIGGAYFLLRGRLGLVLTAIRDDETAARSSGAGWASPGCWSSSWRPSAAARPAGCWPSSSCRWCPAPQAASSACSGPPRWLFATIIGGLGTIEGPIIGTIVYIVLQQTLQSLQRLVPDHPRPGGHRGHAVRAAGPVGPARREVQHPAVPRGLLPVGTRRVPPPSAERRRPAEDRAKADVTT